MFKKFFSSENMAAYKRLIKSIKPYKWAMAIGITTTILASSTDAGIAWAVKPIVDKGLVAKDVTFLKWLPLYIIIIFVLRGIFNFCSTYYISRVGRTVIMDFRQQLFDRFLKLPASFYDRESSGKLLALMIYNVEQLASATTDSLVSIVKQSFLAIGLIVVMFIISWHLTLFFIVVAPVIMGVMRIMTKRLHFLSHGVQSSVGDVTDITRESIDSFRVIRTFGGEGYERKRFNKAARVNRNRELKVVVANALGTVAVQILIAVPMALVTYFVHLSAFNISVGSLGAMIVAILRLQTPLRRLTKISTPIQKGIAAAQSIFAVIDTPVERDTGELQLGRAQGVVEFKDTIFSYANATEHAVCGVNFKVNPGETIALVGHSGAGKSTVVNLLPRFYDVTDGEILLDGHNIENYKLADLRRQFSFVSQHISLFNDTVANNIAYGQFSDVSRSDVIKAATAANFMEVVELLPDGFDTVVGENGVMLSGGQRQRLAIARALLKDAPILILDEATSALDTESERLLQGALDELMSKRTTLVIAHRLSTVERADCIIVLDHGKIVESGTHQELLEHDGYYSKLYRMQFGE